VELGAHRGSVVSVSALYFFTVGGKTKYGCQRGDGRSAVSSVPATSPLPVLSSARGFACAKGADRSERRLSATPGRWHGAGTAWIYVCHDPTTFSMRGLSLKFICRSFFAGPGARVGQVGADQVMSLFCPASCFRDRWWAATLVIWGRLHDSVILFDKRLPGRG